MIPFCVNAQTQTESNSPEPPDDTNPTKAVFMTLREEYFNLPGDSYRNAFLLRKDHIILERNSVLKPKGIILRWDVPLATTHFQGRTETGLGDIYFQSLLFPHLRKRLVVAAGSGFLVPTATDSLIGQGKWQAAPMIAAISFFPKARGYFLVKLQDFFSFAGNGTRLDIHYLLTTPTLLWRTSRKNWILVDAESKTDWERDGRTSLRAGVQLGRMFNPKVGFWIKPEFPFGRNREGDWTLKLTLVLAK